MTLKENELKQACQDIEKNCSLCLQCVEGCEFLQGIGEDPVAIAERGPSVEEAYSCSFCGLCETVCPASLSMKDMFYKKRTAAVENREIAISEYRYLFPDRKITPLTMYRELSGIHYDELLPKGATPVLFFPGCTMLTYSPELVQALSEELKLKYNELAISIDCCGLPLFQLGLPERGDAYVAKIKEEFAAHEVKTLIVACPNCYYQWRPFLKDTEIQLMTIYDALMGTRVFENSANFSDKDVAISLSDAKKRITLHDSCPDRKEGIFAEQAREALRKKGYTVVEMTNNRDMASCCGSGGHVSHFFRPYLSENLKTSRVAEAQNTAAVLSGYCLSCVLNFAKVSGAGAMKVQHVLNLILGLDQDFSEIKAKSQKLFEGPEGEIYWDRVMAEE